MRRHRQLVAWQVCRELIREVYLATKSFPSDERFGLTSQLRRAAVSAASNLAEGMSRLGPREGAHGCSVSLGSLAEVDTLFAVAEDQGYLEGTRLARLEGVLSRASALVLGLQKKLRAKA